MKLINYLHPNTKGFLQFAEAVLTNIPVTSLVSFSPNFIIIESHGWTQQPYFEELLKSEKQLVLVGTADEFISIQQDVFSNNYVYKLVRTFYRGLAESGITLNWERLFRQNYKSQAAYDIRVELNKSRDNYPALARALLDTTDQPNDGPVPLSWRFVEIPFEILGAGIGVVSFVALLIELLEKHWEIVLGMLNWLWRFLISKLQEGFRILRSKFSICCEQTKVFVQRLIVEFRNWTLEVSRFS